MCTSHEQERQAAFQAQMVRAGPSIITPPSAELRRGREGSIVD